MSQKMPVSHHKAMGNYRPSVHGKDGLPVEIPDMPGDMPERAKAIWKIVTEQLLFAGYVARVDLIALRLLCESYCLYLEAQDVITAEGLVLTTDNRHGKTTKAHPAVSIRDTAFSQVMKVLIQFGLTPSARTGLVSAMSEETDEEKEADAIFGIGRN